MTIEDEIVGALDTTELKVLLTTHGAATNRPMVERDLRQRRPEIELELSKATADWREAQAEARTANFAADEIIAHTGHKFRLGLALLAGSIGVAMAVVSRWPGWRPAQAFFETWIAPFSSNWLTGGLWVLSYGTIALLIYEAFFFAVLARRHRWKVRERFGLPQLDQAVQRADAVRHDQLVHLVRDHVTEILNTLQGPIYSGQLRVRRDPTKRGRQILTVGSGLTEVGTTENEVSTSEWKTLLRQFSTLPGASIGVSGPRGAGKTTLLSSFCSANPTINGKPAISVATSAPVEYESREFLLHVFAALCRRVIETEGGRNRFHIEFDEDAADADRRRRRMLARDFSLYGKLLLLAGAAAVSTAVVASTANVPARPTATAQVAELATAAPEIRPTSQQTPPAQTVAATGGPTGGGLPVAPRTVPTVEQLLASSPLFTGGIALSLFAMMMLLGSRSPFQRLLLGRDRFPTPPEFAGAPLAARAKVELRHIAFQRTYTSGWGGGLKLGVGLETSRTGGVTVAERTESLPDLVVRFRSFVEGVADHYQNVVIIGIDELDKLKTAQQAEAFLNGVKSIFGINRCFYLVSVSEHALAAFERRGLGFRDAFDSALDDIIQLDFLSLEQSRALLARRILRLPDPFLQVCHMFSGGLPRDLIRQGRTLLDVAETSEKGMITLKQAVDAMAEADLATRLRATGIAVRNAKETVETNDLLAALAVLPAEATLAAARGALGRFRGTIDALSGLNATEDGRTLARFAREMAVHYEIVILIRIVARGLESRAGWDDLSSRGLADEVARVRQALEISAPLAEVRLAKARRVVFPGAI
ncbi:P-loop NTPase fold protein [Aquidulcibacter paucihalophilus]|nr:P-loop NTPase fold protein [Aquidulcibacter paucihalophilus]